MLNIKEFLTSSKEYIIYNNFLSKYNQIKNVSAKIT
jgi:hypothetical protein